MPPTYAQAPVSSSGPNSGPYMPPSTFPETMPSSVAALPLEAFQDARWTPPAGWFANVELGLSLVQLQQHETGQVFIGGTLNLFQLPTANLNPIVSPRIGVGYRFAELGEITLTYQLIDGQGTTGLASLAGTGPASLRSRLNVNVADLEWWGSEISLGQLWDMKWHAGVRFASIYSDTQANNAMVTEGVSNLFNGAGPCGGLDLWRALPLPGLALYSRFFGAYVVSPLHHTYQLGLRGVYAVNHAGSGGPPQPGDLQSPLGTPLILDAEVGLGYTPPWARWVRFSGGYQFQGWFTLGNMGASSENSTGHALPADVQFLSHTFFVRAEIHY